MQRRGVGEREALSGILDRLAHCDDKVRDGLGMRVHWVKRQEGGHLPAHRPYTIVNF